MTDSLSSSYYQDDDSVYLSGSHSKIALQPGPIHNASDFVIVTRSDIKKVLYISTCFLILHTAFIGIQNLGSKVYTQPDTLYSIHRTNMIVLYAVAAGAALITPNFIKKWRFKTGLFIGSLGYLFNIGAGIVTSMCSKENTYLWCTDSRYLHIINISCSVLNGLTIPIMWIFGFGYLSACSSDRSKGQYFGIFSSFIFAGSVIGNLLEAYIIETYGLYVFYITAGGLAAFSSLMFLCAPGVSKNGFERYSENIIHKIVKIFKLAFGKEMRPLLLNMLLSGMLYAVFNSFQYTVIYYVLPYNNNDNNDGDQTDNQDVESILLIIEEIAAIMTGSIAGKLADYMKRSILLTLFNVITCGAVVLSFLCYYQKSLVFVYVMAALWSVAYAGTWTTINIIMAKDFEGTLDSYAVVQLLMNLAALSGFIMFYFTNDIPLFLTTVGSLLILTQISLYCYRQKGRRFR